MSVAFLAWVLGRRGGSSTRDVPQRTVYNSRTQQFEQLPIWEFQELLREGKIDSRMCSNCGHAQYTHRQI